MKTPKKIRCCSCKRRIHKHEPDVMLQRLHSEERVYYHSRCADGAMAMVMLKPDVWVMIMRHVEGEAN